jgi:hypothetical protein
MSNLTEQERDTLEAAAAIIAAHTPKGASWSFAVHPEGLFSSSCYFDSAQGQHMLWGESKLSRVVDLGISLEAKVDKDAAAIKARQIAKLKAELAQLGEVLP